MVDTRKKNDRISPLCQYRLHAQPTYIPPSREQETPPPRLHGSSIAHGLAQLVQHRQLYDQLAVEVKHAFGQKVVSGPTPEVAIYARLVLELDHSHIRSLWQSVIRTGGGGGRKLTNKK